MFEPKGTLTIAMIKKSYTPGETIKGTVKLLLDNPAQARRFSISFTGEEWVNISCGSGRSRRYKKEETKIHAEENELSGEGMYSFVEKNFQFRIPEDAPPTIWMQQEPTIGEEGAGLRWIVHAKLDIPWGRDKNARKEIVIE